MAFLGSLNKILSLKKLSKLLPSFLINIFFLLFQKTGEVFSFSLGNKQILHVSKPEMVREIVTCTSLDLGKPSYLQNELGPFLGRGILTTNGTVWAHQNKTIAPELYMVKVKVRFKQDKVGLVVKPLTPTLL